MSTREKIIQPLYEIVIYVFPFILLFLLMVGIQAWRLEETKTEMSERLKNSDEMIRAAQVELYALKDGIGSATEVFSAEPAWEKHYKAVPDVNRLTSKNQSLVELGVNVLSRVEKLKNDSANYLSKDFVITKPTGRYYAVVISYSELGYAIIQREHLTSLGFGNVKILVLNKLYALTIDDAKTKTDPSLKMAINEWKKIFTDHSDAFIRQY